MMLKLPRFCSASGMFALTHTDGFHAVIRKKVASLMRRTRGSSISLLKVVADDPKALVLRHLMRTMIPHEMPQVLEADRPCAARSVPGKSVVCVCNATYCDTITRTRPPCGGYVAYTSSEAGSRFKKSCGKVELYKIPPRCVTTLELNSKLLHQELTGFGGAATDSTGINWKSLKDPRTRQHLIDSYFSKRGIEYSLIRVPMGGTDFSTRAYAYNELPAGDKYLTNFTLSAEDYDLKIPFILAAMKVATHPIHVVSSLWSPPPWMKDSNSFTTGYLKKEYYQTLADYFCKFMENYEKCKIPIWGITTTNEPLNGVMLNGEFNRLQWTVYGLGQWIQNHLGPTIRNSTFKHVKIIVGDDQRYTIPLWFNNLIQESSGALKYIDGVGVHFYYDHITPAAQLTKALEDYPEKFLIYTEASEGVGASEDKRVDLGSWSRAEDYASNIIEDLNNRVIGWIDWNMCLNASGGPTWVDNRIDAPVIVGHQEFYKQPMFYALGHFSKFLPRGSRRLQVEVTSCLPALYHVAALTTEKTIVVVILNKAEKKRDVIIKLEEESAQISVEAKSLVTIEFPYKSASTNCWNSWNITSC